MKKILSVLCAAAMLLALSACTVDITIPDGALDSLQGEAAPTEPAQAAPAEKDAGVPEAAPAEKDAGVPEAASAEKDAGVPEAASAEKDAGVPEADASAEKDAGVPSGEKKSMGMPGGGGTKPDSYDAVIDVTEDADFAGQTLASENGSENVIHVFEGATAKLTGCTVTNAGEGNGGDAASFYGVGATLLVSDGELYVSDTVIESSTAGGTGVFAYDTGVAYVSGVTIRNTGRGGCGGIHAAGGGTLYAWDCDVDTTGGSSAAIRSDRGGGTMVIDGGSYVSENGTGAIYCTADISVHDAYLFAGASEGIAIEGKNTIRLFDCDLTCNMQPSQINDNKVWNTIVYQSMSGDSEIGTSEFDYVGGSLTCNAGPVVYTTNTRCYITFEGVDVTRGDATTYWLQCTGNSSSRTWGTSGKNGAHCIFTGYEQAMQGDVVYDTISSLDLYLLRGSALTGAIVCDGSFCGGYEGEEVMNLVIDKDSVWNVTGDSIVTGTLSCAGSIAGAKVVGTDGTVYLDGAGFTVTVGAFETAADASEAGTVPAWEDYAVENPLASALPGVK